MELPGRWRIPGTVSHDHVNKAALQRPLSSPSVQNHPFLQSNVNFHPHRAIGMNSPAEGYFFCLNFLLKTQSTATSSTFLPRTRADNHLVRDVCSFHDKHSRKCPGLELTAGILFLDKKKKPRGIFEQRSSPINSTGAKKFSQKVLFSFM